MPRVSVLMPVYNTAPFLRQAIDSLLGQTFGDFELILIDDASTDGSWEIMSACAARDARIVLLRNQSNMRQAASLNRGLDAARGQYILRQDSDDLSLPQRLAAMVSFMDEHPRTAILGSYIGMIDEEDRPVGHVFYPMGDPGIQALAVLRTPFTGPSVMMRATVLRENGLQFDPAMDYGEDYDICSRLLRAGEGANLPDTLLQLRIRRGSDTDLHSRRQEQTADKIALRNLAASGLRAFFSGKDILLLRSWAGKINALSVEERHRQMALLKRYLAVLGPELGVSFKDVALIRKKLVPQYVGGLAKMASKKDMLRLWASLAGIDPWGLLSVVSRLVINKFF